MAVTKPIAAESVGERIRDDAWTIREGHGGRYD